MLPDRVSNPGPLTYESGALPIALRGPATAVVYEPSVFEPLKFYCSRFSHASADLSLIEIKKIVDAYGTPPPLPCCTCTNTKGFYYPVHMRRLIKDLTRRISHLKLEYIGPAKCTDLYIVNLS